MKETRSYLRMMFMLMALVGITAYGYENEDCTNSGNTDTRESIYGEWWLVGWHDEGTWFKVDTNFVSHRHLSIELKEEGYTMAYSMVNEIYVGLLTVNGSEMSFGGEMQKLSTEVLGSRMENLFFEKHICDIKSYQLEGNLLRLYYTDDDYFVFTSDFDDSEEHCYEWKNGLVDPYIGEVTTLNDGEVEVKIIQSPSYAINNGSEYLLKVEPCEGAGHVTDRTGTMHNDQRMGWIIVDDEVNERQGGIYYYPLKTLAEEYLTEGLPVIFSGELYPTWRAPWDNKGDSDCYYLNIDINGIPSALTTIRNITDATSGASSVIYDLQGRRLPATPQKGMYIQNGKKIVIK